MMGAKGNLLQGVAHHHRSVLSSTQTLMGEVMDAYQAGHHGLLKECFGLSHLSPERALLITADQQTQGVGTDGKGWASPPGNLFATYALPWPPNRGPQGASQVGALAVLKTLSACGLQGQIKWINDVLIEGHKVGGILCALHPQLMPGGWGMLLVGVGLNVNMEKDQAHQLYDNTSDPSKLPFTSLKMASGRVWGVAHLQEILTREILLHYELLAAREDAFSTLFAPLINQALAFRGQRVAYLDLGQTVPLERVLARLTSEGYLVLVDDQGHETIHVNGKIRPL